MANTSKERQSSIPEPRTQNTKPLNQVSHPTPPTGCYYIPSDIRIIPAVPITVLQDLVSVHHLLSLDPSAPTLAAENAALETFCALVWGYLSWQEHVSLARRHFGRPELWLAEDIGIARSAKHGVDCVYRRKGLSLFREAVETVNGIDAELGSILESCRGDWMVRFCSCGSGVE